jgi:peroxiredoxin Q/BCP
MIEQGALAPHFTLHDQHDNAVTLSALRGTPVVLYFYPRADTSGCTTQACGIRDHRADYAGHGAVVLGVSRDTVADLKRFAEKYALDFTLLADPDHSVSELYGVWGEKSSYGRTYFGILRTTFVIDADGRVARVLAKVKPATHDEQVLAALAELS